MSVLLVSPQTPVVSVAIFELWENAQVGELAAFGVIWSTIFTLCALSGWLAWQAATTPPLRRRVAWLFALNAFLNVLWSLLYFKLQRPDWALYEVGLLWLSILALIVGLWRLSRWASLLLLPYAVWVAVAAALNLATVRLNGPFA